MTTKRHKKVYMVPPCSHGFASGSPVSPTIKTCTLGWFSSPLLNAGQDLSWILLLLLLRKQNNWKETNLLIGPSEALQRIIYCLLRDTKWLKRNEINTSSKWQKETQMYNKGAKNDFKDKQNHFRRFTQWLQRDMNNCKETQRTTKRHKTTA